MKYYQSSTVYVLWRGSEMRVKLFCLADCHISLESLWLRGGLPYLCVVGLI